METYFERRAREEKENKELMHTIVTEFLNSKFLKDFHAEELKEAGKETFSDGTPASGIGEGHYFKTYRFYITETFNELLNGDFKTIRECKQLYRHIHDTVTTRLQTEVEDLGDIEDNVTSRFGNFVTVETNLDDIFDTLQQEFAETLTDEECEKFAKDNSPCIETTT